MASYNLEQWQPRELLTAARWKVASGEIAAFMSEHKWRMVMLSNFSAGAKYYSEVEIRQPKYTSNLKLHKGEKKSIDLFVIPSRPGNERLKNQKTKGVLHSAYHRHTSSFNVSNTAKLVLSHER